MYRGTGENLDIRLARLYDVVSTVSHPELSPEMATRIGDQYSLDLVAL